MLCANVNCDKGKGKGKRRGKRATFRKAKPWAKYCSTACGYAVRQLSYYHRTTTVEIGKRVQDHEQR